MKYATAIMVLFLFGVNLVSAAKKEPPVDPRTGELTLLKRSLLLARDSLQRDIATRWGNRQRSLEQRETDKEHLVELNEKQEKLFNAYLMAKEEGHSLERRIENAQKKLDEKRVVQTVVAAVLDDVFKKEAEAISGLYPLDTDSARLLLETIRKEYRKSNRYSRTIKQLAEYWEHTLQRSTLVTVFKTRLLPDGEAARSMSVARFGTVFAYAITEDGAVYTISQSGREGANRYRIKPVESPLLAERITSDFNAWAVAGAPVGSVRMDVMQSDLSGALVSGHKVTFRDRVKQFVKAGGPVMIPLGLLPVWALILLLIKLIQFIGKRRSACRTFTLLVAQFEKKGVKGVQEAIVNRRNVALQIAAASIDSKVVTRKGAESAAREILLKESAHLGGYLNTLGVIAGVAPLLGLLGTVAGMIRLFEVITRFGTGDPKLLAGGISEALITTEAGLCIAVPVLLVHNFLRNYKNGIITELQTGTLRLINRLYPEG